MDSRPFISICIPAYKNEDFLERLLNSISIQTFKDFEVVVSDDSPNDSLQNLINTYSSIFKIRYSRNDSPLGSPANWNNAIQLAGGDWIKIMHDDDWFANEQSLSEFAEIAYASDCDFIFSGFVNVDLNNGAKSVNVLNSFQKWMLRRNPLYLFRKNYIGHPSTTLIRNDSEIWFDEKIKWVVDFEFYIRKLYEYKKFCAIQKPLINIGLSKEQITKTAFRNKTIEIPENLYLLRKSESKILEYIFVYDYYWRLIRNLAIRKANDIEVNNIEQTEVPAPLIDMVRIQSFFPLFVLKIGVVSKILMSVSWVIFLITRKIK